VILAELPVNEASALQAGVNVICVPMVAVAQSRPSTTAGIE
jgi:hypothetical protein